MKCLGRALLPIQAHCAATGTKMRAGTWQWLDLLHEAPSPRQARMRREQTGGLCECCCPYGVALVLFARALCRCGPRQSACSIMSGAFQNESPGGGHGLSEMALASTPLRDGGTQAGSQTVSVTPALGTYVSLPCKGSILPAPMEIGKRTHLEVQTGPHQLWQHTVTSGMNPSWKPTRAVHTGLCVSTLPSEAEVI